MGGPEYKALSRRVRLHVVAGLALPRGLPCERLLQLLSRRIASALSAEERAVLEEGLPPWASRVHLQSWWRQLVVTGALPPEAVRAPALAPLDAVPGHHACRNLRTVAASRWALSDWMELQ